MPRREVLFPARDISSRRTAITDQFKAILKVAGIPITEGTGFDQFHKSCFAQVLWIALGHLVRRGRFRQFGIGTLTELKQQVQLKVESPAVAIADKKAEEDIRKVRADAGILSNKTWAAQCDLDYEVEQANIAAQPKPAMPAMEQAFGQRLQALESLLENCGTGDGGFQGGNSCAADGGGGSGGGNWHDSPDDLIASATSNSSYQGAYKGSDVTGSLALEVRDELGLDIAGYQHMVTADAVRHILNRHGPGSENRPGHLPVTADDIKRAETIIASHAHILRSRTNEGRPAIVYVTPSDGYFVTTEVVLGKRSGKIDKSGKPKLSLRGMMKTEFDPLPQLRNKLLESVAQAVGPTSENDLVPRTSAACCWAHPSIIGNRAEQIKQSAVAAALESVRTTDEARALLESLYP
ncbi:MAG: hypothetical protein WD872_20620 [Pirellulaceae bacterium]